MPFNQDLEWQPTSKQAQLLRVPFSVSEAGMLGGAGTGKSELLLMFPIVHEFYKYSSFKQVFLRRTHKQLNKEIVPRSQDIYPKFGAKWNGSDNVWVFPRDDQFGGTGLANDGARIFLAHCENENDVHNFDSMQINLFTPDEIQSLTEYIYIYIALTRVRSGDPRLPAITRFCGMPGDVGHTFVKKRFIDPYTPGGKLIVGKAGRKRIFFHATLLDNKHIDPNYKQSLEALPEAERQAKLLGSFDAYLGQVFSEFRDKKYPEEPDNAMHLIAPFDIPSWWPKICAIDWGYSAMCSVGWAAISPNRRVYVYRHQMFYGKKIELWSPEVKHYVDVDNPADIVICHSANQHRGDPHSILEQVESALGCPVGLGVRDRIAGKSLLHEYLRWEIKEVPASEKGIFNEDHAQWLIRNRGLKEYQDYIKTFDKTDHQEEQNLPKLMFFDDPDVRVITDTIKACVYEKSGTDGKKKEDVAEFHGDDPYDMIRMLLHCVDGFFDKAKNLEEELQKTQAIHERLALTQDHTAYYRNMRQLESQSAPSKGVRAFHRRH